MEKAKVKKIGGNYFGVFNYNIGILRVLVVYCSDKFVSLGVVFSDTIQDSDWEIAVAGKGLPSQSESFNLLLHYHYKQIKMISTERLSNKGKN